MYYLIIKTNTSYRGISAAGWRARPQAAAHFATHIIALQAVPFVSAFARLRKVTSNFVMNVFLPIRPSVHLPVCPPAWNNGAPTRPTFIKFDEYFPKMWKKIQFALQSDTKLVLYMKTNIRGLEL